MYKFETSCIRRSTFFILNDTLRDYTLIKYVGYDNLQWKLIIDNYNFGINLPYITDFEYGTFDGYSRLVCFKWNRNKNIRPYILSKCIAKDISHSIASEVLYEIIKVNPYLLDKRFIYDGYFTLEVLIQILVVSENKFHYQCDEFLFSE